MSKTASADNNTEISVHNLDYKIKEDYLSFCVVCSLFLTLKAIIGKANSLFWSNFDDDS